MTNRALFIFILLGILYTNINYADATVELIPEENPAVTSAPLGSTIESNYSTATYSFGGGSIWASTSNAQGAPDGQGSLSFIFPGDTSRYLYARAFDFSIPCNATIESMTVRITRRNRSGVDLVDAVVAAFDPISLQEGSVNLASSSVWLEGGAWEEVTYTDLDWGLNLTPELINNPRFGIVIKAENSLTAGRGEALVDAVEMEVCYNVTGAPSTPIYYSLDKVDACYNQGSITINTSGGLGNFEFTIDGGTTWQGSNFFGGLAQDDYNIIVRNDDGTCATVPLSTTLSGDERLLQPGDAVVTCATFPGNNVTLGVEKLQMMNDLYVAGETGYDISSLIGPHAYKWEVDDFGGEVFSTAIDSDRNIYTATTIMYDLAPGTPVPVYVARIDGLTGGVMRLATLPGDAGAGGVEYVLACEQLFVANLSDGQIYRMDPMTGAILSTFDPQAPDNGASGIAPLGERVLAMAFNYSENRLYYSLWNSDYNRTGIPNTIRSVQISPATCDFIPATDREEIVLPWTSAYGDIGNPFDFSMPVADMEFSQDGMTLIMSESGFDSSVPNTVPHESRVMRYTGTSQSWTLQTGLPAGNTNMQYEFGEVSAGLNARGGIAFANSGFSSANCSIDDEQFIIGTADALRGADCNTLGCIYGLQYLPITGGRSQTSVLLDVGRDLDTQQKSVFGDIDMVGGCPLPLFCCPNLTSNEPDVVICPGDPVATMTVDTQADSIALVYHTSIPQDSASVYTNGTPLDTVEVTGGSATLSLGGLDVSSPITYYVYAINHPTSSLEYCRPYDSIIVTVRNLPTVTLNDPADRCIDDIDMAFAGSPLPGPGESGSFSSNALAGFTDIGNGTSSLDISQAGPGTYTIEYTFTDSFGCSNTSSVDVTIYDLPVVNISDPGDVCVDGLAFSIAGSPSPASGGSGSFTSDAVGFVDMGDGTAMVDPSLAGVGSYFATYTYTDVNGCTNTATVNFDINALPVAGINDPADECLTGGPMIFNGTPAPGPASSGFFTTTAPAGLTDNGDGTASLDMSLSGPGIFDVQYIFTDANGCQDDALASVEVFDTLPYVELQRGAVCGDPNFGSNTLDLNSLILSGPLGGSWSDNDGTGAFSGSLFTANPSMEGDTYSFTYTINGPGPNATTCQTRSFTVLVDVVVCYLDLALIKTTPQIQPVRQNDIVRYEVTVCNQGFIPVDSLEVTEYLAPCYGFTPNNGWIVSSGDAVITLTTNNGGLPAGGLLPVTSAPDNCITIPLDLSITCGVPEDLICYSEITGSRDIAGNTGDFDSTPGSDSPQERSVLPGSAQDDSFNDANEDDHDPSVMPLADIALRKTMIPNGPYSYGQNVNFEIEIFNQGNIDLYDIEITDYIPCGFSFPSGINPLWSDQGSSATTVVPRLNVGQSLVLDIVLTIEENQGLCNNLDSWVNEAEISRMLDAASNDISLRDFDSDADNVQGNDAGGAPTFASDDAINGDGSGVPGSPDAASDEDDHDPSFFNVYDLAISKTEISSAPYAQDSLVIFEIVVENEGGMLASNIRVEDYPEIGLQYESSDVTSNPDIIELSPAVWEVNNLAPGATATITAVFRISSGFQDINLVNRVAITADDGDDFDSDPSTGDNVDEDGDGDGDDDDEDSETIQVSQYYDLSIIKSELSTGPYFQGSLITYETTVFNDGTLNASNIRILDTPQAGLSYAFDNADLNPNITSLGNGEYRINSLDFGFSETFQISYEISSVYQDVTIFNRVQIIQDDGDDLDSDPDLGYTIDENGDLDPFDDDESEVIVDVEQFYDLSISKTEISNGPYFPGDNISFRIDVSNEGTLNASDIEIIDISDADLFFVSDDASGNSNVSSSVPQNYSIQSLPFGSTESVVLTFQVNPIFQLDTVRNLARIIADDGDDIDSDPDLDETVDEDGDFDPFDDDEDLLEIEIQQFYDLSISKTLITTADVYPGDEIRFRIDIVNEGTLNAANIEITEDPDFGLFYLSNNTSADPNITEITPNLFLINSLPAYSSTSFEISYTIDFSYLSPEINNIVRISADDGDDIDSDPDLDETVDEDGDGNAFDDDEDIMTVGVVVGFQLGDYIWHDLNGNGIQDFGEPGLEDIKVKLYSDRGFQVASTHTDAFGFYAFDEIFPGNYYLQVELPEEYRVTRDGQGFDPGSDSDLTEEFGPGTTSLLELDGDNFSIDGGLLRCANIGGTVWFDYDEDDMMDLTENGINGMRVELYKLEPYGWTLWDAMETGHNEDTPSDDGFYKFCADPGQYYLRFINPPETLVTVLPGRGAEDRDSDVTGRFGEGTTDDFYIQSGEDRCDIGAGYYVMGSIGDYVWHDANGNGMRESYEDGVAGVVVNAVNVEGEIMATAVSDEEGRYMLDYLGKDQYFIQVIEPVGYSLAQAHVGEDETIDSDIDHSNGYGTTQFYSVAPGEHTPYVDAGLVAFGILPVEWMSFDGENKGSHNSLVWEVSSEVNVSHYEVERAINNSFDFEVIGIVDYNPSIEYINRYDYKDYALNASVDFYQYRIKQIDLDGRFSYSNIIALENESIKADLLDAKIYPNPSTGLVNISLEEADISVKNTEINILDYSGKTVRVISDELSEAMDDDAILDLSDLDSGVYFIKIINNESHITKKLIIVK